jgi:lipoprotein-anchoring transpeptidase ErfK/SrfK
MKTLLKLAPLFLLASEPAWAQSFIPPPASPRYDRLAPYRSFTPPAARPGGRTLAMPANLPIPAPETAAIGEEYAKGSIVIVNHERRLYFVEQAGRAIRYPVAIGKLDDQWEGVQTITAKRENPTWYPVSHGCFRMHNPHIIELYEKVQIGANVYVVP